MFSLVTYFTRSINCVEMSVPISQFLPPHHLSPWYPLIYSLPLCLYICFENKIIYTILLTARLQHSTRASLVDQMAKNPPAQRGTWVRSLGWRDPLEEGMAIHSRILAWRIPMDKGAGQATVHSVAKSRSQLTD